MKKKINVKPVTEIDLCFDDGKTIELVFNVESLMYFTEIEDVSNISKLIKSSMPELCAKMLYSGAVVKNGEFTLDEARKVVSNLDINTITEIIQGFSGNLDTGELKEDVQKNLMREFLLKMSKK